MVTVWSIIKNITYDEKTMGDSFDYFILPNLLGFENVLESGKFKLTERSKKLFELGKAGQGYIGLLDAETLEIHLIPAFNKDDGLVIEDINGTKFILQENGKKWYAQSSAALGKISGDLHANAVSLCGLEKKGNLNGKVFGFGFWKSGYSVKILDQVPIETAVISDEYYVVKEKDGWQVYYMDYIDKDSNLKPKCITAEIPKLKQFLEKEVQDKHSKNLTSEERKKIEEHIAKYDKTHPNQNRDAAKKIKMWKSRSTSQNAASIRYTLAFFYWFIHNVDKHSTHAINLQREIPFTIFKKIVEICCQGLNSSSIELATDETVAAGPNGIQNHINLELDWIVNAKLRMNMLIELANKMAQDPKEHQSVRKILDERIDLKRFNIFLLSDLPNDEHLNQNKFNHSYIFIRENENFPLRLYYIENGKKIELDIKENKTKLNQLFEAPEFKVIHDDHPIQYRDIDPAVLHLLHQVIGDNKGHEFLKQSEPRIFFLENLPVLTGHKYNNSYIFTEDDDGKKSLFYVQNGMAHLLLFDEVQQEKFENLYLERAKKPLQEQQVEKKHMLALWEIIGQNKNHIHLKQLCINAELLLSVCDQDRNRINDLLDHYNDGVHLQLTNLISFAIKNSSEVVELLLARNIKPSVEDLKTAMNSKKIDCAYLILNVVMAWFFNPLLDANRASSTQNQEIDFQNLSKAITVAECTSEADFEIIAERIALCLSIIRNDMESIKKIIDRHPHLDKEGILSCAIKYGNHEAFQFLLGQIDPEITDIEEAIHSDDYDIIFHMLKKDDASGGYFSDVYTNYYSVLSAQEKEHVDNILLQIFDLALLDENETSFSDFALKTALLLAIHLRDEDTVELLLTDNFENLKEENIISFAVKNFKPAIMELLLDKMEASFEDLQLAVKNNNLHCANLILQQGITWSNIEIHDVIQLLIDLENLGCNTSNIKKPVIFLIKAIYENDHTQIEKLLNESKDILFQKTNTVYPLEFAFMNKGVVSIETIKLLFKYDALKTFEQHYECFSKCWVDSNIDLLELLIENKIDLNQHPMFSPMETACRTGQNRVVTFLANKVMLTEDCLAQASINDHVDIVEILLNRGLKATQNMVEKCILQNRPNAAKICTLLLKSNNNLNINSFGNTALLHAFKNGRQDIVDLLLHFKCTPSPYVLLEAIKNKDIPMITSFLDHGADPSSTVVVQLQFLKELYKNNNELKNKVNAFLASSQQDLLHRTDSSVQMSSKDLMSIMGISMPILKSAQTFDK